MANRSRGSGAGLQTVLIVVAIAAFVWGVERWRKQAASRAGSTEQSRLTALAQCLLGSDGASLMHEPESARRRLRALAMSTPVTASLTWFDRCVPLARSLAVHASEVDDTRAVRSASSRVAEAARALSDSVARVGLVWRIRSGDPELDMDVVADRLSRLASEIQLAAGTTNSVASGVVAPAVESLPATVLLPIIGLEPAPVGTPSHFFVGAPLPSITEVARDGGEYRTHTLANEPASSWRLESTGVVRLDTQLRPSADGLAPLQLLRPNMDPLMRSVTPINSPIEGAHVAFDATTVGSSFWLAQWTPWGGTALARFATTASAAAVALAPAAPEALAAVRHPTGEHPIFFDERVAVAPMGNRAVVAYSQGSARGDATVFIASTVSDTDRAPVVPLGERSIAGRSPSIEFCPRSDGSLSLVVGASGEWTVLQVDETGISEMARTNPARGEIFDSRVVVRCSAHGLVAYGKDHPRESPLIVCRDGEARCRTMAVAPTAVLTTMPFYITRTNAGRPVSHAEWPIATVDAAGTLVSAHAIGPVVSVSLRRRNDQPWEDDRVLFDAAALAHGAVVEGLEIYADDRSVLVAISASDGLHLLASDDAGDHWR